MHLIKFGHEFTRRHFLESLGKRALGAGMLSPLWDSIARDGDVRRAYPDEALSVDSYTGGAVKAGDTVGPNNVDAIKNLIDPILFRQIRDDGRVIQIAPTTMAIDQLGPQPFNEATLKHRGKAELDSTGNVRTKNGHRWIGGNPFPDGGTAHQIVAANTLSWGRHDGALYPVKEWDMNAQGIEQFHYQYLFIEYLASGRTVMTPKPYLPGHDDLLRFVGTKFVSPRNVRVTSLLCRWPYDQTKFTDFIGNMPAFCPIRTRRFPTTRRFEPIVWGSTLFPTDVWMTGDPFLTWKNFRLIGKRPWLGSVSKLNWSGHLDNWEHRRHGGASGHRFFDSTFELVPEAYVVELEPAKYHWARYSKKRIWFDARTLAPLAMIVYDRRGEELKHVDWGTALYERPTRERFAINGGQPLWSWTHIHSQDVKDNQISIAQQVQEVSGEGVHKARFNDPSIYDLYCSVNALHRYEPPQ